MALHDVRTDASPLTMTSREMTILCLIAAGLTNSEVASSLHISRHTVAQHVAYMLQRARARNRAELVARAYAAGTLSVDIWPPSAGPGEPHASQVLTAGTS
jgi:DNA-binding CsgD family transcriptional regulator